MKPERASLDAQAGPDFRAGRSFGPPTERNQMLASSLSKHQQGVISVVPETEEIVALCLEGEFDMANAPAVREEIDRTLEDGKHLIVDLSEATFIDSSFIDVLLRAAKATRGTEQAIVLQHHTAAIVERVIEITGIEHVLPRAHDRREAVNHIPQEANVSVYEANGS